MWKLLLAIVINFVLFLVGPHLLEAIDWISPVSNHAWIVLGITAIGVSMKTVLGDFISGEFLYYKHGYDFCVTTLGASMSGLSLQILSDKTLFPGLAKAPLGDMITSLIAEPANQARAYLFMMFAFSCLGTLITARIAQYITLKQEKPYLPGLLPFVNFSIGTSLLGFYVLLLITKA